MSREEGERERGRGGGGGALRGFLFYSLPSFLPSPFSPVPAREEMERMGFTKRIFLCR